MLTKEDCHTIGKSTKTHGVEGKLVLTIENNILEKNTLESLFIDIDKQLVPFFIAPKGLTQRNSSSYIVKFDDINTEEKAKRFKGCKVYVPTKDVEIEEDLESDEVDYNILIGYSVYDDNFGDIGEIEMVNDYSGNIVMQVISESDEEILIPFNPEWILELNHENKVLGLETPEGLLDVYLD